MDAPATPGVTSWSAHFAGCDNGLEHTQAAGSFELSTAAAPEHRLAVTVTERSTGAPVADAVVRLGDFRAATDASGTAELKLPKGRHNLAIWKSGYEVPEQTIEIPTDAAVEVQAERLPEDDPDAAWRA